MPVPLNACVALPSPQSMVTPFATVCEKYRGTVIRPSAAILIYRYVLPSPITGISGVGGVGVGVPPPSMAAISAAKFCAFTGPVIPLFALMVSAISCRKSVKLSVFAILVTCIYNVSNSVSDSTVNIILADTAHSNIPTAYDALTIDGFDIIPTYKGILLVVPTSLM